MDKSNTPSEWFRHIKSKDTKYTIGNNLKCWYCGSGDVMTKDHFHPKSKGGHLKVWCCLKCNSDKANKTPRQWISYLNVEIYRAISVMELSILHRMKIATETLLNTLTIAQ